MKKLIVFVLAVLALCTTSIAQKPAATSVNIKTKVYCDHCSKCEFCQSRIEKKLLTLKGVKSVSMDVKNERIKVSFDPVKTTLQKIRDQINKAGYDADNQKAPELYVEQLDGCCKKQ
jgi:copper chaperone CopZ